MTSQAHCARCGRFIGEDCLEGHDGTWFGQGPSSEDGYTGVLYCGWGRGCNADAEIAKMTTHDKSVDEPIQQ